MKAKDIEEILEWVNKEGKRRGVSIEVNSLLRENSCWVFDYGSMQGKLITCAEELPTTLELKALKKKELEEELKSL